jgi:hypothetical protein
MREEPAEFPPILSAFPLHLGLPHPRLSGISTVYFVCSYLRCLLCGACLGLQWRKPGLAPSRQLY